MATMFTSGELEELQTCPYNSSHRITAKRFSVHLVKCRKAHPNIKYVTCPFFAGHKVPEPELTYHLNHVCDKRKEIEQQLFHEKPITKKWEVERTIPILNEETWDVADRPSYNPQLYCEQNRIIRNIQVETPSTRKQFRIAERQRHQMLDRLDEERNKSSVKGKNPNETETSEREPGTTSDASGVTVYSQSELEAQRKDWSKILYGRGRGIEEPSNDEEQNVNEKFVKPIPSGKTFSETTSDKEIESTSDVTTLCDTFSDISVVETVTREEQWVKVGRGRGRGRRIKK